MKQLGLILLVMILISGCIHPMYFTKTGSTAPAEQVLITALVDDFNDKDNISASGGIWEVEDDSENGGNSTGELQFSSGYLHFDYSLGSSYQYRYAIARLSYEKFGKIDVSAYEGIRFKLRGSGNKFKFHACVVDDVGYNWHGTSIEKTSADWTEITILWKDLVQEEGWGVQMPFDPKRVLKFEFRSASMADGEEGGFEIDDIRFIEDSSSASSAVSSLPSEEEEVFELATFEGTVFDAFGNAWSGETDLDNGGDSSVNFILAEPGFRGSKNAVRLEYTLGPSYEYRYAILGADSSERPIDISAYKGIQFYIKGKEFPLKFHICTALVEDFDFHGFYIERVEPDWVQMRIPFAELKQEGWGAPKQLDLTQIVKIQFQTASQQSGENGWFVVDNVELYK